MVKVKEEKERLKADVAELRTLSNKLQQDIGQVGMIMMVIMVIMMVMMVMKLLIKVMMPAMMLMGKK